VSEGEGAGPLLADTHVDKIMKGAKSADPPVEQPTIFDLVISGETAKVLGLKIPQSLLILAGKVIEKWTRAAVICHWALLLRSLGDSDKGHLMAHCCRWLLR
jgi:hypothetical protein